MIATRLAPLRHAAGDFIARWRSRERQSAQTGRHLEAFAALLVCASIVILGWLGDERIAQAARRMSDAWRAPFQHLNGFGESGWIFAVAAVVMLCALLARHRGLGRLADAALGLLAGRAFFIIAANAVSGVLSLIVKSIVGRARPRLFDMVGPFHFDLFSLKSSLLSFPSGHAVTVLATATALAFMSRRIGALAGLAAILVCVARVVTGAHYPSDVLGGVALGLGTTILLRRAFAARGIVFRESASGIALRGAGLVGPVLRQLSSRPLSRTMSRSPA